MSSRCRPPRVGRQHRMLPFPLGTAAALPVPGIPGAMAQLFFQPLHHGDGFPWLAANAAKHASQ